MQNLKGLIERLFESKIDFVLIGGYASVVHGATLVTQVIDICAALTESNIQLLRNSFANLNPIHRMNPTAKLSFLTHPKDLNNLENIYLKTDYGVLDILSRVPPIGDFERIKSQAIIVSLYGHKCHVISLQDLITVKQSMKRPKDQQALEELQIIQTKLKPNV